MRLPAPRRLPSGSWFVRVIVNGEVISITRPTEKECLAEAAAIKAGKKAQKKTGGSMTVGQAIDQYIEKRTVSLSPSTVRGYRTAQRNRFPGLIGMQVSALTDSIVQKAINAEARSRSGKTVVNDWTLFRSAIQEAGGPRFDPALPPVVKHQHEFLTAEQIPLFLDAIKGTDVELAALLGLHSLRRSEIVDLTWKDIDLRRGLIRVSGAAVLDENGLIVHKATNKTSNSARSVPIMIPRLRELLETIPRDGEYLVPYWPHMIYKRVNAVCSRSGLPKIGTHGLRHSFASLAVHCGMSPDVAMRIGGWDDIGTMKKIYTHVSEADLAAAASTMAAFYTSAGL